METTVAGGLPLPIPEGPFFDVLSRLSVKDLHRHTCLSSWRDYFINFPDSRKNLPQTLQGFFVYSGNGGGDGGSSNSNSDNASTTTGGGGSDTDQDGDGSSKSSGGGNSNGDGVSSGNDDTEDGWHFFDLLAKSMPIPDDIDTKLSFLSDDVVDGRFDLLCSCNGLLLFGCKSLHGSENYHSLGYIVCNPATKQWVRVPSSGWILTHKQSRDECCKKFESTFLFFDPAADPSRLLLIQFWHDEDAALKRVHIYSSDTREWSDRSSEWMQFARGGEWGDKYGVVVRSCMGSSFVNGMLHFFVERMSENDVLVVAMDGEGSVRRIIHGLLDMFSEAVFIGQSQGRLHCIRSNFMYKEKDQRDKIIMSVHVLQDYDDAGKWKEKLGIRGSALSGGEECRKKDYEVVAFHPDGNLLYIVDLRKGELIQYDMGGNYPENEQVLRLYTPGRSFRAVIPYVPCFSRSPALEAPENPAV